MRKITAAGRARRRGVDWMDIEPRPLRTRRRLGTTPAQVIHDSWAKTFNTLDQALRTTRK